MHEKPQYTESTQRLSLYCDITNDGHQLLGM